MKAFRIDSMTGRTAGLCGLIVALIGLAGPLATGETAGGLPESGIPDSIGICVHGFPGAPGELEQFVQTGVRVVRSDLQWAVVEKGKGKYDFSDYDRWVDSYGQHGIRMLFILDYGNTLYTEEQYDMPQSDEARAAFARFAAAAARRYRDKGVMFELWNEPDGAWPADEYMAWARAVVPAMRQADPNVVIMGPAAHQWALRWLEDCFQSGLLELLDAVSIHLYIGGYEGTDQPQEIPEVNAPDNYYLASIRELIEKYAEGRDIPLSGLPNIIYCPTMPSYDPVLAARAHANGNQVWWYDTWWIIEDPLIRGRLIPWQTYAGLHSPGQDRTEAG